MNESWIDELSPEESVVSLTAGTVSKVFRFY